MYRLCKKTMDYHILGETNKYICYWIVSGILAMVKHYQSFKETYLYNVPTIEIKCSMISGNNERRKCKYIVNDIAS